MRLRSTILGMAVAAASLAAVQPSPAATTTFNMANSERSFGITAITTPDAGGELYTGVTVTETARGNNLGNPPSTTTTNLGIECAAVSTGAAATGVVDCYARGLFTGTIYRIPSTGAKPGSTDARASVAIKIPMEPYEVCIRTRILLRDLSTPFESPLSCSVT